MLCTVLLVGTQYQNLNMCISQLLDIEEVLVAEDEIIAERLIDEAQPDIIISEMELVSQKHGSSLLHKCRDKELVVVSSDSSLAVKAFEINASDFVLAPLSCNNLQRIIEKAIKKVRHSKSLSFDRIERMFAQYRQKRSSYLDTKLMLKEVGRVRFIDQKDIKYIKGAGGNYIEIHFEDGSKLLHRETLSNIENNLNSRLFKRVHRSIIVNIDFVSELMSLRSGGVSVKLKCGSELKLGRHKKALVDTLLVGF